MLRCAEELRIRSVYMPFISATKIMLVLVGAST